MPESEKPVDLIHKVMLAEVEAYKQIEAALFMLKRAKYGTIEHHQLLEYTLYKLNTNRRAIQRAMKG